MYTTQKYKIRKIERTYHMQDFYCGGENCSQNQTVIFWFHSAAGDADLRGEVEDLTLKLAGFTSYNSGYWRFKGSKLDA